MPYLLLGPDDYSKKMHISSLVSKLGADLVVFTDSDPLPSLSDLSQTDLFSKPKVFWFQNILPDFSAGIPNLEASKNRMVITVKALDKRKKENKEILANRAFEVKEFILPHGTELDAWIIKRAKELGASINLKVANLLAIGLGRDSARETKAGGQVVAVEEIYDLWQAENELKKLIALANGKEISEQDVKELAHQNTEVDVFDLTNAIAENQKQKALRLMQDFLLFQTGSDEKGSIIQLNALLSEQFRSVAIVQGFLSSKAKDDIILEKTGWKSGRLFVMKKIAGRFKSSAVLEMLNKFSALDEELKTSSTPPRVLLDLIISQLFA